MGSGRTSTIGNVLLGIIGGLIIAAAGLLIYDGLQSQRIHKVEATKATARARNDARERMRRDCLPLAAQAEHECEAKIGEARSAQEHDANDLEAQRITALWTAYMGAAALLGMAVSIVGVGLVYFTFRESRRAASIANQTYQAFVAAEDASLALRFVNVGFGESFKDGEKTHDHYHFNVVIRNIGRSTAELHHGTFGVARRSLDHLLKVGERHDILGGCSITSLEPFKCHIHYASPIRRAAELIVTVRPKKSANGNIHARVVDWEIKEPQRNSGQEA